MTYQVCVTRPSHLRLRLFCEAAGPGVEVTVAVNRSDVFNFFWTVPPRAPGTGWKRRSRRFAREMPYATLTDQIPDTRILDVPSMELCVTFQADDMIGFGYFRWLVKLVSYGYLRVSGGNGEGCAKERKLCVLQSVFVCLSMSIRDTNRQGKSKKGLDDRWTFSWI
jgi:hypothetical protein